MIQERDIERMLDQWLASGPSESPDRVLAAVVDRIGRQGQRGAWRFPLGDLPVTGSRRVGAALAVLLLAVVGGVGMFGWAPRAGVVTPSVTATPTAAPSATAAHSPRQTASPTPAPTALGKLEAGSHSSAVFPRRLTYVVPDGWWNDADDPTAFLLSKGHESANNIELLFDAYSPILDERGCQAGPDWDRPHGTSDLIAYWRSHPGLKVDAQDATWVGGLRGWNVTLSTKSGWKSACGSDGIPIVNINWGGIPFVEGLSGSTQLTILADPNGRTIVLHTRGESPRILGEESAIVDSFVFDVPATAPKRLGGDGPLGALEAGSHFSRTFAPTITYTVPAGWWNGEDGKSVFGLSRGSEDANGIEVDLDVSPPALDASGCSTTPRVDGPHSASDLVAYWTSHPGLAVSRPHPVSIGGLTGWQAVVSAKPGSTCHGGAGEAGFYFRWDDGVPVGPLVTNEARTFIVLDTPGHRTLAIKLLIDDPALMDEVMAVVESFEFDVP